MTWVAALLLKRAPGATRGTGHSPNQNSATMACSSQHCMAPFWAQPICRDTPIQHPLLGRGCFGAEHCRSLLMYVEYTAKLSSRSAPKQPPPQRPAECRHALGWASLVVLSNGRQRYATSRINAGSGQAAFETGRPALEAGRFVLAARRPEHWHFARIHWHPESFADATRPIQVRAIQYATNAARS